MKLKRLLFVAVALIGSVVIANAQENNADEDSKYAVEMVKAGTKAPNFQLKTVDGKSFKLSSLKGKVVVLDFWASWCPDCRKDAPNIVRMYREFKDKGVFFVGVSFDTEKVMWERAIEKYDMEYTAVSELKKMRESTIAKQYGVKWIPAMVVIDKKGNVVLSTVLSEKVEKKLTELTATKH